ncbi:MerR family transcriptional regulator [Lutibacter citreus]|uniref:helix-turn-helix domain-containing protein n=1 Tax=Lutibacter citreus TaxID=2138210 RepID=UPI000DBE4562|nr:helix-turn-helix domain-containing protein [Lutibacter citreus]
MNYYVDPFKNLFKQLDEIKEIALSIKDAPKEDYTLKFYTVPEASKILKVDSQTIKNYNKAGFLHIETYGINRKLIHHSDLFTEDNKPKSYKYLRKS